MKLHIGCGTVYLEGYVNIDGKCDWTASMCPDAVMEKVKTTFDNYYKHKFGEAPKEVVVDRQFDISSFPWPGMEDECADEIVMEQVLEHFQAYKVGAILSEVNRVLKVGGSFVVNVPDVKRTARLLADAASEEEEDFIIRLIHGTQRNEYAHHYCGYVPRTLKALLSEHGFGGFEDLPVINFYPTIRLRAIKERSL